MPIFFICTLIFVAWLWYERNKHNRLQEKQTDAFWQREEEANHTRNKDISNLPYLHMEMDEIPGKDNSDSEIATLWNELDELAKQPMLNLSSYTNTDLKLAYGVGNFARLSGYDDNYNKFLVKQSILARRFSDIQENETAISCYRLALSYGSKKLKDYTSLGELYIKTDQPEKLSALITELSKDETIPRKEAILRNLKEILATYQ